MTQIILEEKLRQAINDIIDESVSRSSLDSEVRRQLDEGVRRESSKKAQRIFEYLQEFVYQQLRDLEGRVGNLEERLAVLSSARPSD